MISLSLALFFDLLSKELMGKQIYNITSLISQFYVTLGSVFLMIQSQIGFIFHTEFEVKESKSKQI